ncbi:MAG: DUF3048 domain-containing protein [Candidatus Pacebacteria bacterium]|nr:DUF3048 domain-containing protein [Candidatus Paceibacterota bacterium]
MKRVILPALLAYLISAAGTFAVFSMVSGDSSSSLINPAQIEQTAVPTADPSNRLAVAPEAPKTEECPLNGKMYTVTERESWDTRRPLAVMIENHTEARPQSGLSRADIVYEAVVEGGITRFMPIFYCEAQAKDTIIAPVRSARQFFLDMASEYNMPLYAHVGGSNGDDTDPRVRALEHLSDYGWTLRNDLNQFSIGYPTFVRNYNRLPDKEDLATEHTMESSTERLWALGEKRKYTNMSPDTKVRGKIVPGADWRDKFVKWLFQDEAASGSRGTVNKVAYEFWTGYKDFTVEWDYNLATNMYKRVMGGEPHLDLNTNAQIEMKNVVVIQTKEYPSVDVHKHNYIVTGGTGKAWIFQNGNAIEATWSKKDRESRMTFSAGGKPVKFARGPIWISVVNMEIKPTY